MDSYRCFPGSVSLHATSPGPGLVIGDRLSAGPVTLRQLLRAVVLSQPLSTPDGLEIQLAGGHRLVARGVADAAALRVALEVLGR